MMSHIDSAAAGIEARGRLVEEDDARVADEGHGEVEPSPHAPRVGRDRLLRGVDQVEALEQLRDAAAGPRPARDGAGPP